MATESSATRAGQKIDDRYRLQALLKEEAASDLYSGVDETSSSKVWVRVLRDEYALQPKVVDHFAELPRQLMNQLGAGLPRVLAVGNDSSGVPYTVWEQLEGRDLEATLSDAGEALSFDDAMGLMAPVLRAVSRLHDLGKAHGELEPESVLLVKTKTGATQPTLLHVGRPRDRSANSVYTAPELKRREPNAESDVYSLGMILFRMLSGRVPRHDETTSLREAAPDLSEDLAALIDSCLAEDPDARPPNALELLARAEKIQKRLRSDARRDKARPAGAPAEPETGRRRAVPPRSASAAAEKARDATPIKPLERGNRPSPAPGGRRPPAPSAAETVAARQAAVQEALEKARKPVPTEATAAGADGAQQGAGAQLAANSQHHSPLVYVELAAFALFGWLLLRFTPALTSPDLEEVQAALGPQFAAIGIAMAVASVAVVVRLYVMQATTLGKMLLPAALAMTGSAVCLGVVVSAHVAGAELTGSLQAMARQGLVWFNGASFAMGGMFMLRWGIAHVATQSALAAGSFAGAFLSVLSASVVIMQLLSRSP